MSSDWESLIQPKPYDAGRFQASRLTGRPSEMLAHTLEMARKNRDRLTTRVFRPRERQFLRGFVAVIEEELERRAQAGDEPSDPVTEVAELVWTKVGIRRRKVTPSRICPRPERRSVPLPPSTIALPPNVASPGNLDPSLPAEPSLADHYEPHWAGLDTLFAGWSADLSARQKQPTTPPPPADAQDLWTGPAFLFSGFPEEDGREPAPPPPEGEVLATWTCPEFLLTAVPEELAEGSGDDSERVLLPSELMMSGPEYLFTGIPEETGQGKALPPLPQPDPSDMPPTPEGLDPGLLVAPDEPPPSLREQIASAWQTLCDHLQYTPLEPDEWEP